MCVCVQQPESTVTSTIYQKIVRIKSGHRLGCGNTSSSRPSTASTTTVSAAAKRRPMTANPVLQKNSSQAHYTISNLTFPTKLQSQSLSKLASASQSDFNSTSVVSNLSMNSTSCSNLLVAGRKKSAKKSRVYRII